ncbi:MAG: YlbF family regulator [Lachnospiraceae bacterium]|nr:YlbF family regulator [Lachnospiraceae bacterium]
MQQRMEEILNNLVEAFKDSQEYKEYQRMREVLAQEPEKEKAVNEFRRRNFELHKYRNTDLYNEMDRVEHEFAPLREQAFVNEFLAAELAVCRMVQRINYRLMEEIEFELGFENL